MSEQIETGNEITVPADLKQLPQVLSFVEKKLDDLQCLAKIRVHIGIVIDEIFSNIARHSGPSGTDTVTVRFIQENDPRAVRIEISDTTRPFDPLSAADPDLTAPARKRKIGGLGLFMVKNLMDGIEYEYRDGLNILTVRKFL